MNEQKNILEVNKSQNLLNTYISAFLWETSLVYPSGSVMDRLYEGNKPKRKKSHTENLIGSELE
jgi:hypothetical protein